MYEIRKYCVRSLMEVCPGANEKSIYFKLRSKSSYLLGTRAFFFLYTSLREEKRKTECIG